MADREKNMLGKRLANAYLSSVISISLVLFLVGAASLLLVNARSISDYFKENMKLSVMMKQSVGEDGALACMKELSEAPWVKSAEFISRERGEKEMAALLGDDFLDVFETSPIPLSVDLTLKAAYVSADSLAVIGAQVEKLPQVEELVYRSSLVDKLNSNISKVSLVMSVFIVLLLFISFVLINNTVRLGIYARRFTIRTMTMVGATRSFIRAPFLVQAVFQGLCSAILGSLLLVGVMFVIRTEFPQLFTLFSPAMLLSVTGIVAVCGVLICSASTWLAVGRLVSVRKAELYY